MVNSELFNKIADQIEAHPETLNMETWVTQVDAFNPLECGTVACIAGWALIFSAKEFPTEIDTYDWHYKIIDSLFGEHTVTSKAAEQLLGIDKETGKYLFMLDEDMYTVKFPTLLRELAKGKPITTFLAEVDVD